MRQKRHYFENPKYKLSNSLKYNISLYNELKRKVMSWDKILAQQYCNVIPCVQIFSHIATCAVFSSILNCAPNQCNILLMYILIRP